MKPEKLSVTEITERLDDLLDVEFSFLKTEHPAAVIAELDAEEQYYILTWVERVASTNIQLAYQFITQAVEALDSMDRKIIEAWALHAMDMYDQSGLHAALDVIRNVENFVQLSHERTAGAVFEEKVGVLSHFLHGLSGRQLKLDQAENAYTDTETVFLPPLVASLQTTEDNFSLYKITVAFLWAQTRFGTFRAPISELLSRQSKPKRFLSLFHALDACRLEACIERELPGLYRDLQRLKRELGEAEDDKKWQKMVAPLREPGTSVDAVVRLTEQHCDRITPPGTYLFHGELDPEAVELVMASRLEKEKAQLRSVLRQIADDLEGIKPPNDKTEHQFDANKIPDPDEPDGFRIQLTFEDQPMPVPDIVHKLTTSIVQDLGDIPDEYLQAAGEGEYDPSLFEDKEADPDDVWKGTYHEEGAFLYNEWDYRRQHYRKNWCAVREKDIKPQHDDFVTQTLRKYSGLVKHLRKIFEAMRDEDRLLKRQVYGDNVDIDALVEALADARDGSEMSDRLFTRMHRTERNIAVCFMVDMSGSTKGWINDAERESLVLLAETLETLGDRYAIYGFSGMARKKCEIFRIKDFDEPYDADVRARISGITPQDYTRMGFAIRHLSHILQETEARTRILITLSDGKPDDYDNYRGDYGIEDTRRALVEARRAGIHPYCITIDREARDYLPHMYGPAGYTVIDEVYQLPLKVSDIYRRLTT